MERLLQAQESESGEELYSLDDILNMPTDVIEELLEENERLKRQRASVRFREFKVLSEKPQLVLDCIEFLRKNNAVYQEGLFRIPGTNSVVEEIRAAYEKQEYDDVLSIIPDTDANVVGTTLKGYFRLLDSPIIPNETYEEFMEVAEDMSGSGGPPTPPQLTAIREKVQTLPSPNKEVLCYLMIFLQEVVAQKDINQMRPQTLATCIAPSLMRFTGETKKETGKMMALVELGYSIKILSIMLSDIDFMEIVTKEKYEDMKKATKYQLRGAPQLEIPAGAAASAGVPPPVPKRAPRGGAPPGL